MPVDPRPHVSNEAGSRGGDKSMTTSPIAFPSTAFLHRNICGFVDNLMNHTAVDADVCSSFFHGNPPELDDLPPPSVSVK